MGMGPALGLDLGGPPSGLTHDKEATARRRNREGYRSLGCRLPSRGWGVGTPARPAWIPGFQGPCFPQLSPYSRQAGFMTSHAEVTRGQC